MSPAGENSRGGRGGYYSACKKYDCVWLWIDLETTHLDPCTENFGILEIAAVITDPCLNILDRLHLVLHQPDEVLQSCSEWCLKHFAPHCMGGNGLLAECRASTVSMAQAEEQLLQFIQRYSAVRPPGQYHPLYRVLLAGCGVNFDKGILLHQFPSLENHISYKSIDLTVGVEMLRRWRPDLVPPKPQAVHRAMQDVHDAVALCKYYKHVVLQAA